MPAGFERNFDAHVYFTVADGDNDLDINSTNNEAKATLTASGGATSTNSTYANAIAFRNAILKQFSGREDVFVGDLICEPIGPHPQPMFEVNFPERIFAEVTLWLLHNRDLRLSILVHQLTGDDFYDHTQAAMWMGPAVPLKYEVFKRS